MKFSDERPTLLKGIDTADRHSPVTPRWLSPHPGTSGFVIAKGRDVLKDIQFPVTRQRNKKPRQRVPGVSIPRNLQPWRAS
ncbi:hypothetical protein [Mycobacterium phage WXIN]|nr:hypothetical protein [Mycobacterium phage WXIN]